MLYLLYSMQFNFFNCFTWPTYVAFCQTIKSTKSNRLKKKSGLSDFKFWLVGYKFKMSQLIYYPSNWKPM